jgi:hypothetical protein
MKWTEIARFFSIAAGEMLLKAMGKHWALLNEYRKAAGKCPNVIGQPLGILQE